MSHGKGLLVAEFAKNFGLSSEILHFRNSWRIPLRFCLQHSDLSRQVKTLSFDILEDYFIYPFQLLQELPIIPIPLLPGDGEVSASLQKVMQRTYEAGPYHREIDYSQSVPPPKLSDEQTEWVQRQLSSRR